MTLYPGTRTSRSSGSTFTPSLSTFAIARLRDGEGNYLEGLGAKGEISTGVEGLNNKIRVVTRRSFGLRTYDAMEVALYHTLGDFKSQNQPIDSAKEAKKQVEMHIGLL